MIGENRFIQSIHIRNLLSFGADSGQLELRSLNVLIGQNASGKSNFLEVIGLLQAAPKELTAPFRSKGGGGIQEWLWQGEADNLNPVAEMDTMIAPASDGQMPLRHQLSFTMLGQKFVVVDESVENSHSDHQDQGDVRFYYRYRRGRPVLNVYAKQERTQRILKHLEPENVIPDQSILSQRKGADEYPEITYMGKQFERIKLYRAWNVGRNAPSRRPQPADMPDDFLEEDASNLALVLNTLEHVSATREPVLQHLELFHDAIDRLTFKVHGGTIQLFLEERFSHDGNHSGLIPATRLSDGTMRYLCLLAILCHPNPPPLICIEEPEMGLHPDIIPSIAKLLIAASHRTQLIVTTHSDILIDALTEVPEAVVVCEKEQGSTRMRRLRADDLAQWLEKYRLGQLWVRGDLGGTRW